MLACALRFVLLVPLLLLSFAIFGSELRSDVKYLIPLLYSLSALAAVFVLFAHRVAFFAIGVGICLLPAFGSGALSVFVCACLLAFELKRLALRDSEPDVATASERFFLYGVLAFLLPSLGGLLQATILEADFLVLRSLFDFAGPIGVLRYLQQSFSEWRGPFTYVLGYYLAVHFGLTILRFERDGDGRVISSLLTGLAFGAALSVLVFALQYTGTSSIFSLNRTAFWLFVNRYPSSFSDPNAFGIVAALLIPLLFFVGTGERAWLFRLAGLAFLLTVPWSGSRTVWFGLIVWMLLLFSRYSGGGDSTKMQRRGFTLFFASFLFLALLGQPTVNEFLQDTLPISASERVIKTLHWEDGSSTLSSRLIFGKIALAMWTESPVIGVGLGRFYTEQAAVAESIGLNLEGWRDNANNFYLQVLAEEGLIGILLTIFALYFFAISLSGKPLRDGWTTLDQKIVSPRSLLALSRIASGVLALLLFTGPHLFFEEVRFLSAVFLTMGVAQVEPQRELLLSNLRRLLKAMVLLVPLLYVCLPVLGGLQEITKGLYAKEHGERGFFAWTARSARLAFCGSERPEKLEFRALNPDLAASPLRVRLARLKDGVLQTQGALSISDSEWKSLPLGTPDMFSTQADVFVLDVSRVWSPVQTHGRGDWRVLGVMLQWPEGLCKEPE